MKAQELRIGNYLHTRDERYKKVVGLRVPDALCICVESEKVHCGAPIKYSWESDDSVFPIPLTEELLLKCGFLRSDYYGGWSNPSDKSGMWICKCIMEGEGWRRSATDWGIRNIIDEPIEGGFYAEIEEYPISQVDIKYLHQLQNLFFALTGEELEVNL